MEALRRLLQQAAAASADEAPDQARAALNPADSGEQPAASTSGRPPEPLFAHRCLQPPRALHSAPPSARVAQSLQALAAAGAQRHCAAGVLARVLSFDKDRRFKSRCKGTLPCLCGSGDEPCCSLMMLCGVFRPCAHRLRKAAQTGAARVFQNIYQAGPCWGEVVLTGKESGAGRSRGAVAWCAAPSDQLKVDVRRQAGRARPAGAAAAGSLSRRPRRRCWGTC